MNPIVGRMLLILGSILLVMYLFSFVFDYSLPAYQPILLVTGVMLVLMLGLGILIVKRNG